MYALQFEEWNSYRGLWNTFYLVKVHNIPTAVQARERLWESLECGTAVIDDVRTGSDWTNEEGDVRATIRIW